MHKLSLILITFLALALSASTLTAQDKITLFGGYSYLRPSLTQTTMFVCSPGTICPAIVTAPLAVNTKPNLNGWEVSATYRVFPWLGMEADFSGHYGTTLGDSTAKRIVDTHFHLSHFQKSVGVLYGQRRLPLG